MNLYILVTVVMLQSGPGSVSYQEFTTLDKCHQAEKAVLYSVNNFGVHAFCLEK